MAVVEVDNAVLHLAVGGLDEAEVVDFGVDAERRDKADVRAFRGLDRAEAAVVGIVHVSHLEAGALARQTAGAEGREAALVGDFGQGVGLVHELRQRIGAEKGVDNRRDCLGVDQVDRGEHLVVADVHTLADSAAHAGQAHAELVVELLADCADSAVRQVVDVVDVGLGVNQLDEVFDNLDDVLLGQDAHLHRGRQAELLVDTVAADVAQVVTLLGEEEVCDYLACGSVVGSLGVAELAVDILDSLLLGVGGILLEGVEDNRVVGRGRVLLVEEDCLDAGFEDVVYVLLGNHGLALQDDLVALERRSPLSRT